MRARRISALDALEPGQRAYFDTGEWRSRGAAHLWFFVHNGGARATWRTLRAALLEEWSQAHPGTRPFAWWQFDATEPRRRIGGVGDSYAEGLELGIPRWWATQELASFATRFTAIDPNDPPMFESEAAYLERLGLLTDAERRRLPADAFVPEPLSLVSETSVFQGETVNG